jgi:hypothetical protein
MHAKYNPKDDEICKEYISYIWILKAGLDWAVNGI